MTKKLCAIVLGMLMVLSLGGCATLEGLPNLDKDLTQLVGLKPSREEPAISLCILAGVQPRNSNIGNRSSQPLKSGTIKFWL